MGSMYLGIDLGGTEIKMAVVSDQGKIIEENRISNKANSDPSEIAKRIILHAKGMKNFKKLRGTGIGAAGDIDQEKGVIRFSPNLPNWKGTNLRALLGKELPGPIMVDNDANVAALGAYWLETKGKAKNMVCITMGTGIGGGLIFDGKLYRGATGSAGEIGHVSYEPFGPECKCGNLGCIERYVGAQYLNERARELLKNTESYTISTLVKGNYEDITPKVLAEAAEAGDSVAKKVWEEAGERLGIFLSSIINLLNPDIIVLAGGVSRANNLLLKPIKDAVAKRAFKTSARACRIIISEYDRNLGVVGAALLAKK
ncbi:MAG: ROK family protein [Endomicrobiales bacterium]|nr:ROK family protein [Endomicrobiales bacterium]